MDHMSPLDSMFLHVEDGITHMHIGSCSVFEGPAPGYDEIVSLIASKLPVIPRYRQKVRFVPGGLGRPVWVDDPHFNLDYHVRHSALPPPGSESDLNALMGRLMSQELDRHRPLWESADRRNRRCRRRPGSTTPISAADHQTFGARRQCSSWSASAASVRVSSLAGSSRARLAACPDQSDVKLVSPVCSAAPRSASSAPAAEGRAGRRGTADRPRPSDV